VAAGIWTGDSIDKLEKELYREVFLLPQDINRNAVVNLVRIRRPSREFIEDIINIMDAHTSTQTQIRGSGPTTDKPNQRKERPKMKYIPQLLSQSIWATTRGSTVVNWSLGHFGTLHNEEVDLDHLETCAGLQSVGFIKSCNARLKIEAIQNWSRTDSGEAIWAYTLMQIKINDLTNSGVYQLRRRENRPLKSDQSTVSSHAKPRRGRGRPKKSRDPGNLNSLERYFKPERELQPMAAIHPAAEGRRS